jgi:prepilin-type N-terminal cleavage/methylation domain-containing protein
VNTLPRSTREPFLLQRLRRDKNDERGFTLIELLIVIVILGILAAIVVFAVNGIQNRGTASACKADVETVTVAAEAYDAQHGRYADSMDQLVKEGFLHSVPSTSNGYTIVYRPNNDSRTPSVSVSSRTCPDAGSSQPPGTDPTSDYCVELASALDKYSNLDLSAFDDFSFGAFLDELAKMRSLSPQEDLAKGWDTYYAAFKQIREILGNYGLKWSDLAALNNGENPGGLSQEQTAQLQNDLQKPMNSDEFQQADKVLGKYGRVICGLNMDSGD